MKTKNKDVALINKPKIELTTKDEMSLAELERLQKVEEKDRVYKEWNRALNLKYVLNPQAETLNHYVKLLIDKQITGLIVKGKAGLGKSLLTTAIHKSYTDNFIVKTGYTSILSLYKFLYENKDKHIIFDDVEGLLSERKAISILKACLFSVNNKRLVSYETTSRMMGTYPEVFEFTGTITILVNEIPVVKSMDLDAIFSRIINHTVDFTYSEILAMSKKIITTHKELSDSKKKQVLRILDNHITEVSGFNFRLLERLITFVKYNSKEAEKLFLNSFSVDEDIQAVAVLLKNKRLSNKERIRLFMESRGKSRRTYFRLKKEYLNTLFKPEESAKVSSQDLMMATA